MRANGKQKRLVLFRFAKNPTIADDFVTMDFININASFRNYRKYIFSISTMHASSKGLFSYM